MRGGFTGSQRSIGEELGELAVEVNKEYSGVQQKGNVWHLPGALHSKDRVVQFSGAQLDSVPLYVFKYLLSSDTYR